MALPADTDVNRLTERFKDRSLPKAEWTHRAHFAVALCLLSDANSDAFAEMPKMIRAYNEATGVANTDSEGYHETITLASLRVADAFLRDAPPKTPLERTLDALMGSQYGRSNWLLEHWSKELLFSAQARRTWHAPDLTELPF